MNNRNNMAQPLSFAPITMAQAKQVESVRRAFGNTLYVYTFASLFAWQEDEQYTICLCDDGFLVKNAAEGAHAYLFPCGSDSKKKALIDALLSYEKPVFGCMTEEDRQFLEENYPGLFAFEECRNEFPYLYDKDAQIALRGKGYKSLRHQINIGRAAAKEWTVIPLSEENVTRALSLNRRWAQSKGINDLADVRAAETALTHFSELSLWGLLFQADGRDLAYVVGTFITPQIFDVSFCKVLDNRCDCYIKWELYRNLPQETKTVNSEEDLGLEGLRRHKLLRQPKELTRIWKGIYQL